MATPIVNERREIEGWTDAVPEFYGSTLRHEEAERLTGGGIICAYVQIEDPAAAIHAGAPAGWQGEWRCLALCSERAILARPDGGVLPVVKVSWRGMSPATGRA